MAKEFGDHALMFFDADEFIRRIEKGLKAEGSTHYTSKIVQYYRPNDFAYFKDVHENLLNVAFWKRESFAFQQEFRILIHKEVTDHLRVNIGDISDISKLFRTEDLLNSQISIVFDVQDGDDFRA